MRQVKLNSWTCLKLLTSYYFTLVYLVLIIYFILVHAPNWSRQFFWSVKDTKDIQFMAMWIQKRPILQHFKEFLYSIIEGQ